MEIITVSNTDYNPLEGLTEEFVDEEYRLEKITKNCQWFYGHVLHSFPKDHPIPFREIAELGEQLGKSYPACVQWMRMLWKAGKVRRFYKGDWQGAKLGWVTGKRWGVHYVLI